MDVEELLRPLTHGQAPDVERIYQRAASRSRRRRALLTFGCVAAIAVLTAALWLTPRDKAAVSTVGDPQADTAAQVRQVIDTLFLEGPTLEQKLAQIDDSTGLEAVVAHGMQDDRAHRLTLEIVDMDLSNPTVVAHIEFSLDGAVAMSDGLLELRRAADRWQATRASYCALVATGGLQCPGTYPTNEFGPDVRLLDAPIGEITSRDIRSDGPVVLAFHASGGEFALELRPASGGGSASLSGDPSIVSPLVVDGASQADAALGGPYSYIFGVTRSEVTRLELQTRGSESPPVTTPRGFTIVDTFAVDGIPQLRFFLVAVESLPIEEFIAVGYSADGVRLTDSLQK